MPLSGIKILGEFGEQTYVEDVIGEGKIEFCSSEIMSTQRLTKRKSDKIVFHVECVSITEKAMCKSSAFVILINGNTLKQACVCTKTLARVPSLF